MVSVKSTCCAKYLRKKYCKKFLLLHFLLILILLFVLGSLTCAHSELLELCILYTGDWTPLVSDLSFLKAVNYVGQPKHRRNVDRHPHFQWN